MNPLRQQCVRHCLRRATAFQTKQQRAMTTDLDRHTDRMPVYYSDRFTVVLPEKHTFPMERYKTVHGLLHDLVEQQEGPPSIQFLEPPLATRTQLEMCHDPAFVAAYLDGYLDQQQHKIIGFPWSPEFAERTLCITGATIQCVHDVLGNADTPAVPIAAVLAGGTHHAFAGHGEGYCIFNDIAVAARVALESYSDIVQNVLVVDLDVHQGNGTAAIFENDENVFTFSLHADKNYPWKSRMQSDLDVAVGDISDAEYNAAVQSALEKIEQMLRDAGRSPDLVFFQAGVDPLEQDRLGRLNITREGLQQRNDLVLAFCEAAGIPLVISMGGGYSRPILPSAIAHCDVFLQAAQSYQNRRDQT